MTCHQRIFLSALVVTMTALGCTKASTDSSARTGSPTPATASTGATTVNTASGSASTASATATSTTTGTATTATGATTSSGNVGISQLPSTFAVVGTIGLDPTLNNNVIQGTALDNHIVELKDDSGVTVAQGTTNGAGAFTIAIDTGSVNLVDATNSGPIVLTMETLFLADGTQSSTALGVKRTIALSGDQIKTGSDGAVSIDTGEHKVKTVGAIVGTVKLQTNEDPTGTDVYVPGTSNIAKTDKNGQFLLGFLPAGSYTIRADRSGYGSAEFDDVEVKQNQTTVLASAELQIATGPTVGEFVLQGGGSIASAAAVNLLLKLPGATKFRVSQLADFRDTVYRPVDATVTEMTVPFSISGGDGPVTIHLEAADSNGLTATGTLDLTLDTTPPAVPTFTIQSAAAKTGYSNTTTPVLYAGACGSATKLALVTDGSTPTAASTFTIDCATAATSSGSQVTIPSGDGVKNVALWAIDTGGRISTSGRSGTVTLITSTPVLSVTPSSGAATLATSTVLLNASYVVTASAGTGIDVHYTTDLSTPTVNSSLVTGPLALSNGASLKFIAIDNAGNPSTVVSRVYTVDTDGPILGSVSAETTNGYVTQSPITLDVSAQGATYMAFGETSASLSSPTWVPYASTYAYPINLSPAGSRTVYAEFKDDAGNVLGGSGSISTTFTIETATPSATLITLLAPETPSGDFDKTLYWTSSYTDTVTFQVQVSKNDNTFACSSIVAPTQTCPFATNSDGATMSTTSTSIQVTPTLTASATYYWRVRAVDAAGNESDWVTNDAYAFTLKPLASAFLSRRDRTGQVSMNPWSQDMLYGWDVAVLGDLNGASGQNLESEIAISLASALPDPSSKCPGCGAVKVIDVQNNKVLDTVVDPVPPNNGPGTPQTGSANADLFGMHVVGCNLDNDPQGRDQLIVTSPGLTYSNQYVGGTYNPSGSTYYNQGGVYSFAYSGGKMVLEGSYLRNATDTCEPYNAAGTGTGCTSGRYYGYQFGQPQALMDPPSGNSLAGPLFGWSVACERRSGGDYLLVGEPGYNNNGTYGRVLEMKLDKTTSPYSIKWTGVEFDAPAGIGDAAFGASVAYLGNYQDSACSGTKIIAIGAPRNGSKGSVFLYAAPSTTGNQTKCHEIDALSGDPTNLGFGFSLADIGSPDSVGGTDKLAVGGPGLGCGFVGGLVRIYGNGSSSALKVVSTVGTTTTAGTCADSNDANHRFGYTVAPAGDFAATPSGVTAVAIGAPGAYLQPVAGAGQVFIYNWSGLGNSDLSQASTVLKTITGSPGQFDGFGARYVAVPPVGGTIESQPSYVLITRPGHAIQSAPPGQPGGFTAAASFQNAGEVQEYANVNLKIGTSFSLTGTDAGEGFGRSLVRVGDVDGDNVADLIVGRPVGRCNGLLWGAFSIISGYDSSTLRNTCGPFPASAVDKEGVALDATTNGPSNLLVSQTIAGNAILNFMPADQGLLTATLPTVPSGIAWNTFIKATSLTISDAKPLLPPPPPSGSVTNTGDLLVIGDQTAAGVGPPPTSGKVQLLLWSGAGPVSSPAVFTAIGQGTEFGTGVGIAVVPSGAAVGHPYVLAGAPGMTTGTMLNNSCTAVSGHAFMSCTSTTGLGVGDLVVPSGGAVFPGGTTVTGVTPGGVTISNAASTAGSAVFQTNTGNTGTVFVIDPVNKNTGFYDAGGFGLVAPATGGPVLVRINADDAAIKAANGGSVAASGFGSYILGLPNFSSSSYDFLMLIANTNLRLADSSANPEYYIVGVNVTHQTYTVLRYESGLPGSMVGGYAKLMGDGSHDINEDGIPDLAISAPAGPGRYGDTGQVRILSGKALVTASTGSPFVSGSGVDDQLIQVVFNPDTAANHFGVSLEYADMNGDGYYDLIVGADEYSSGGLKNAGALYVFPIEAVHQ